MLNNHPTWTFNTDADHGLVVFAQLAHERREVGVAADDDEGVDVLLGAAEVERIDDHANIWRSSCPTGGRAESSTISNAASCSPRLKVL